MATTAYNMALDYWEIFRLAGGNHVQSVLVGANLINTTVTQAALDQAIVDNGLGVKSIAQVAIDAERAVSGLSIADLAAAIAGDSTALVKLNIAIAANPTVIPTPPALGLKNNFIALVAPAITDDSSLGYAIGSEWLDTVSSTVYLCQSAIIGAAVWISIGFTPTYIVGAIPPLTPAPFVISNIIPLTPVLNNISFDPILGAFTIQKAGVYRLELNASVLASNKGMSFNLQIFVNDILVDSTLFINGRNRPKTIFPGTGSVIKNISLLPTDMVEFKIFTDDLLATYSADLSITRTA